ncbi:hypothetical protein SAMN05660653_00144 [Desulfonatronum thiosulfatophilum]|uniref:Uncharacterized protein n=1 Tax=Desulfonatronum thiosulfatophilum TaxID=617002 RepID=A0A1G6A5L4_9BACT|nr:hypothetical protein [Desulfonatronum thiosulfatophilum]SDB03313.1 hypothetical protein SAMN05660653_00144 [Desulfonatronum thiosulfatophilum]
MPDQLIIRSEEDAYSVLQRHIDGSIDLEDVSIQFEGWPRLEVTLCGEKYRQSITPTMMKSFLEFQSEIYRSYSFIIYESYNIRLLSKEERDKLEIIVKVVGGSSIYDINFQEIIEKFLGKGIEKMDSKQITLIVITLAVLFFGNSAFRTYLDHRKNVRIAEVRSDEQREHLQALQFLSEQETERSRIIASIAAENDQVRDIQHFAYDAHGALVKSIAPASNGKIQGIEIDPETAEILTANARKHAEETRLDGTYKILRVDTSDPTEFKVRIQDTTSGQLIDAILQDSILSPQNKPTLERAVWARTPVSLAINARSLQGEIRNAVIISAREAGAVQTAEQ